MADGVTVVDPATTYVDVDVEIGPDTVVLPNCILEAATRIGARATVGPNCHLVNTDVGDDAEVTNTVAKHAVIGPEASVGPFTYLRPGTVLERGAKAGGFVEMKKAHVGEGRRSRTCPTSATPPSAAMSTSAPAPSPATTTGSTSTRR